MYIYIYIYIYVYIYMFCIHIYIYIPPAGNGAAWLGQHHLGRLLGALGGTGARPRGGTVRVHIYIYIYIYRERERERERESASERGRARARGRASARERERERESESDRGESCTAREDTLIRQPDSSIPYHPTVLHTLQGYLAHKK